MTVVLAECIRKVDERGKVLCIFCNDFVRYASWGCKNIEDHVKTKTHVAVIKMWLTKYTLLSTHRTAGSSGSPTASCKINYGLAETFHHGLAETIHHGLAETIHHRLAETIHHGLAETIHHRTIQNMREYFH